MNGPSLQQSHASAVGTDPSPGRRATLAGLGLCAVLPALATSIANVGLPAMARAFHAAPAKAQWVVLAYLLAVTALAPGAGRMGDQFGRRRLLLCGIAIFTLASAACALAPSLGWLVAARVLQGAGAALMMALTLAFAAQGQSSSGAGLGLIGASSAAGTALGPALGGTLLGAGGWPALFYSSLPLAVLAWFLARRTLPPDICLLQRQPGRFDLAGATLLAATLVLYALAMTMGSSRVLVLLPMAVAGAALLVLSQQRATAPLIRLELLRDRALRTRLASNALIATVVMATLVIGPFYLGGTLTPLEVGLAMSAGPLVAAAAGLPAGRAVDRHGARRPTLWGLAAMACGCAGMALAAPAFGVAGYVGALVLITAGYALFQAANNSAALAGCEAGQRGLVSGLLNMSRNLGLITGASLMGSVYLYGAAHFASNDAGNAANSGANNGLRLAFAVATACVLLALALAANRFARPVGQ